MGSSLRVDVTSTLLMAPRLDPDPMWSHSLGITVLGPSGLHLERCQENSYYCSFFIVAKSPFTNNLSLHGELVLEITIEAAASWLSFSLECAVKLRE